MAFREQHMRPRALRINTAAHSKRSKAFRGRRAGGVWAKRYLLASASDMTNPSSWENVSSLIQAKQTRILYPAVHGWNFLEPKTKNEDYWVCTSSEDFVAQLVDGATRAPDFDNLVEAGSHYRLGLNALMGLFSPTAIQVGAKRKRGCIGDAEGAMSLTSFTQQCSEDDDAYAESLISSCLTERVEGILDWTPSDEFRTSSSRLAQLDILASNVEKLLSSKDCRLSRPSYNRIAYTFKRSLSNGDGRNKAIVRASGQLNAMLESGGEISSLGGHLASSVMKNEYSNSPSTSPTERSATFKNILSGWVRANMWNPFPCDKVLQQLVHQVVDAGCITLSSKKRLDAGSTYILQKEAAEEKINNYLINTRTRKWRPAIEIAFDMKRPASLLLEDAEAIFDGNGELRKLDVHDAAFLELLSEDSQYKHPIKQWKKKRACPARNTSRESDASYAHQPLDLSPYSAFAKAGGTSMFADEIVSTSGSQMKV